MELEEAKLLLRMKVTDNEDGEEGCHLTLRFAMQEEEEAEKIAMEASAIACERISACAETERERERERSKW